MSKYIALIFIGFVVFVSCQQPNNSSNLYDLNTPTKSRSISFENPTGEPGAGGMASSEIGQGRKGAPKKVLDAGEEVTLCDIEGSGTIRHIWMTGGWMNFSWTKDKSVERTKMLRKIVIRAYWDGQEHPSIESPIGDFMGVPHAMITDYESAVHSVGEMGAFNFWLPMPFDKNARITFTNESDMEFTLYYQIDYTIDDQHEAGFGRLHTYFNRQNPTQQKEDFELMPKRNGKGRFIGAAVGIRTLHPGWWGEGEIKIYMDGDDEFPTICGTGSEDWVGLSFGIQNTTYDYHGCNLLFTSDSTKRAINYENGKEEDMNTQYISMYRWHLPDPIYWKEECRITIQQIGCCLYEREDDWSTATFWYEPIPSEKLPELPSVEERTRDLDELHIQHL